MKVLKVYQANNGDVFFKHDALYEYASKGDVMEAVAEAKKLFDEGKVEPCEIVISESPIYSIGYKALDGKFLGESGMHVLDEFSEFTDMIYLIKKSEITQLELFKNRVLKDAEKRNRGK